MDLENYPGKSKNKIISFLSEHPDMPAFEIASALSLSYKNTSKQLRELANENKVTANRRSRVSLPYSWKVNSQL